MSTIPKSGLIAAAVMLALLGIAKVPVAHADTLYEQPLHGGTKSYGPGGDIFEPMFTDAVTYPDLYLAMHFRNFSGGLANSFDLYFDSGGKGNYFGDCWYSSSASACLDPSVSLSLSDATIVMHFSNVNAVPDVNWGISVASGLTGWADMDAGVGWGCVATTLEEAFDCPLNASSGPPTFFDQGATTSASRGSWYSDNWYDLGTNFGGTVNSLTLDGSVDSAQYGPSSISLQEFDNSRYQHLLRSYDISDSAPFVYGVFTTATFSGLDIPLDPRRYYRLATVEGRQNVSVILEGTSHMGIAMQNQFVYGTGRVENDYTFYPAISANGTPLDPIVIVPGIMGSELDRVSDGKKIWPDATDMANSGSDDYLDALKLSPSGEEVPGDEINPGDIVREASGTYNRLLIPIPFDEEVYGNLINDFVNMGYVEGSDLFVAPYDWRLDIASSSARVGAVIQNAIAHSGDGKIDIIAHSMGGLAVRDYLANTSDTSFVDKMIFAGTPQLGAPYIFKALEYGDDLGFRFGPFSILNAAEVKSIAQNMPGVYELLPSRRYIDVDGSYILDERNGSTRALSFDDTSGFLTSNPADTRNSRLLTAADAFHASRDLSAANASNVYNIVGCQNPTPEEYILGPDGALDMNDGNGDGSVPIDSAMNLADGYNNYFSLSTENGIDHNGLISNPSAISLIQAIVQGETSTLALEPLGMSRSTEDCLEGRSGGEPAAGTVQISVQGSSTVDVYDDAGNHTGINSVGDVDLGIPGSGYDSLDGATFVTLPASTTYKISIKKASSSTSTVKTSVKVKTYDANVRPKQTTTYPEISLTSSSIATLTIVPSATTSTLEEALLVDPGDGSGTSTIVEPFVPAPFVCVKQ